MLAMRELERADMPVINAWRRDESLIRLLGAPYRHIGPEVDERWFDAYLSSRGSSVRCVTYDDQRPSVPLCLTSLTGIDWVHRFAELQVMVGDPAARGKGVGTFSVQRMLHHAFDDLGLHRVELGVLEGNSRAIHVYERCGFVCEGRRREAVYKNGSWVDMLTMAVLTSDWGSA